LSRSAIVSTMRASGFCPAIVTRMVAASTTARGGRGTPNEIVSPPASTRRRRTVTPSSKRSVGSGGSVEDDAGVAVGTPGVSTPW
jgi:hypothetical protein